MKFLKLRVGVLATVSGLVLMTAGVATAQAQGSTRGEQDHASQGDNKVCVSWESGDVWQTRSPDGKGWHKVGSREVAEVPAVEHQDAVAAVEAAPAIPKIERHEEYKYGHEGSDSADWTVWRLVEPEGDGTPWIVMDTKTVPEKAFVPEVFAADAIPLIEGSEEIPAYTVYHWTRAAKDCKGDKHRHHKGDKHRHHKGDKNCKDESHDSDHSPATPPPATTPPATTPPVTPTVTKTVAKPIVVAPAKAAVPVVVSPAEAAVNPLPVSADAGQADTSGQLAAAGLAGFAAFLALGAGFVLRRRRSDV